MMNINQMIKLTGVVTTCVIISACGADFNNPVGDRVSSSGSADFSKFVAIGDSLTAGYADGALYLSGQKNSFPAVLAAQFAKAGGGDFTQPLVSDNLGGLLLDNASQVQIADTRLVLDAETESPAPIAGMPTTEVMNSGLNGTAFNNMGVPGAKSFHAGATGFGDPGPGPGSFIGVSSNPYFVRFAKDQVNSSMIGDAAAQQPSFYVMWLGNNDVLSYATSGGIGVDQAGNFDPTTYGPNDITDPNVFAGTYDLLVGAFTTANPAVQGMLVNIPDVSTIPYFTTVPYNAVPLDQATADALNSNPNFIAYNDGLQSLVGIAPGFTQEEADARTINFVAGQNAVLIEDEGLTDLSGFAPLPNMRHATAEDLILLPASAYIGTENPNSVGTTPSAGLPWGIGTPLEDSDVLVPSEKQEIEAARLAFNATIEAAADADPNLIFFDAAAIMTELNANGIDYGTGYIDATYATGGAFSLDGVHPTARGYAVIANEMIDVINAGFGASILKVDPGTRTTIFFK